MKKARNLLILLTVFCCLSGILVRFPVRAEGNNYDTFFVVIDRDRKIAEYYYHINGKLHHIPADFSLVSDTSCWTPYTMFTIEGNYYIRNAFPIQIKFADNARQISQPLSEAFEARNLTITEINTIQDSVHPKTEYVLKDNQEHLYFYSEYQEFEYNSILSEAEIGYEYAFYVYEETVIKPIQHLDSIYYAYVLGVDDAENPEYYAISVGNAPWYFKRSELINLNADTLHFGDILRIKNILTLPTGSQFQFARNSAYADRPYGMEVIGSLLTAPTAEFTVTGKASSSYIEVTDGEQTFQLYLPYYLAYRKDKIKFLMPDVPDVNDIQIGDVVSCALNPKGKPVMLLYQEADGDADNNQKTDIRDVIQVNRAVLGKETLKKEEIAHIDFNHNGVADSEDALMLIKKIVGLL